MNKFDLRFLVLYIVGAVVICAATNFVLDGGHMTTSGWWLSVPGGIIIGIGLYVWDLRKARREDNEPL